MKALFLVLLLVPSLSFANSEKGISDKALAGSIGGLVGCSLGGGAALAGATFASGGDPSVKQVIGLTAAGCALGGAALGTTMYELETEGAPSEAALAAEQED